MRRPPNTQKPKNFKLSIKKLLIYCKKMLPLIIIAIILSVASSVIDIIGPSKISDIADIIKDTMATGINFTAIARIAILLLILYVISAIFNLIQGLLMAKTSNKICKQMRRDINKKIINLPLGFLDKNTYGDLMSRTTNDVDTITHGLNHSFVSIVSSATLILACLIAMFITNWILALTTIGATLIGFVLMIIIMSKSQKHFIAQQKNLGQINGHIEECFTAHDIIKVYNAQESKRSEFQEINRKLYGSVWKSQFLSGLMPAIMSFIGNFGYVSVCVVGALLASKGMISVGTIVAFIMYARKFSNPLNQIAQGMSQMQSIAAASERVFDLLDEKEIEQQEEVIEIDPNNIVGDVEFENVKFGYNADKIIINNFSARVKSGQKVAIVGPTGAGKTTLVNLLMRFYELDGGSIKIDGIDTKNIDRSTLHNIFGMVLQDTWLFEGTIRENLLFNKTDVSDEKLDEICEVCGLSHFIKTLPNGYDTVLDDNTQVSVGQKQLLTIARAMIQNCPMLILDEATSSIDTRTEVIIQKAMDKLTEQRTSFVIAHRLSTIKNADLIIVMNNGDIVEQGKHHELLELNGFYANLYYSQFEDKE